MAGRRSYILIQQDTGSKQWRARRHYANGKLGEGSEVSFEHLRYLIDRTLKEHPGTPIRVVSESEGADWWVDETEGEAD